MKKEDIELLKLAAKAIGETGEFLNYTDFGLYKPKPGFMQPYVSWNPLVNDGDALRLAIELNIRFRRWPGVSIEALQRGGYIEASYKSDELRVFIDGDPYAAVRRAIVQAAAEIGKNST